MFNNMNSFMRLGVQIASIFVLGFSAQAGALGVVTTQTVTFHSVALDRETTYIVALPFHYSSTGSYPVLYLLHGATGSYKDWTANTSVSELLALPPSIALPPIVVMPEGGAYGWYVDSPKIPNQNYEMFITRDLINDVEKRFPVVKDRELRGIAGLSMGGHGALSLAAKHPELYSSASSLSGILRIENHPDSWHIKDTLGSLPEAAAEWEKHSVYHLVDRFTSGNVALLFDTGDADSAKAVPDNRQVHERLSNRGIPHTYREHPGTHNWKYWGEHIAEHIEFHSQNFHKMCLGGSMLDLHGQGTSGSSLAGTTTSTRDDHYASRTLSFETENTNRWLKPGTTSPIVLLGSSSMEGIKEKDLFPEYTVANRGISGDHIGVGGFRGVLHRLYCSAFDCKPRAVILLNGTNDLASTARGGNPSIAEIAETFGQVVKRLREGLPNAHIFVVSCTPTRGKYENLASYIRKYNELLEQQVQRSKDTKLHFIDIYTPVVGPGNLIREDLSRDGLHLNKDGYQILKAKFVEALEAAGVEKY